MVFSIDGIMRLMGKIRFFIAGDDDVRKSSEWIAFEENDSFYLAAKNLSGHMKLSLHPPGISNDGKDSQFSLTRNTYEELKEEGYDAGNMFTRWRRKRTSLYFDIVARLFFPTDFMRAQISREISIKKKSSRRFQFPVAPNGKAVEIAIVYSFSNLHIKKAVGNKAGYQEFTSWQLSTGVYISIFWRHVEFDKRITAGMIGSKITPLKDIPEDGAERENLHAIIVCPPQDDGTLLLAEVNGLALSPTGIIDS